MGGTFASLATVFPSSGFQPGGQRFQRALGLRVGSVQTCADAWDELRHLANSPLTGPLSQSAINMGHGMTNRFLQKQLTRQRTGVERANLHRVMMGLPDAADPLIIDPRRVAWLSKCSISRRALTSWPTKRHTMEDVFFSDMFTQYIGAESIMVRHLEGESIPCSRGDHTICDAYGFELAAATLPVATFTEPHDEVSQAVYMDLMSSVTSVRPEPAHLFSGIIPPHLMAPEEGRRKAAIIPDASVTVSIPAAQTQRHARRDDTPGPLRTHFFDTKLIHSAIAYNGGARQREDQCGAVETRARKINSEYMSHARKMDERIARDNGLPLAMDVRSHLTLIGPIRTVVIGHYGECSPDVHHLVRAAAEVLAAKRWRTMGARSEMEARGFFMDTLRKELSIKIWTAIGRHRLNRLDFVGIPREAVQRMRDQNQQGFGMGGRVRGRRGPVVPSGPRVAPPGWARPSDLRAFAAYQAPRFAAGA